MKDSHTTTIGGPTQQGRNPEALYADMARYNEIQRTRRKPEAFSLAHMVKCRFGCGARAAYALSHPQSAEAGTWCPTHGWLFFDSVGLPPTERLTATEIEDRALLE